MHVWVGHRHAQSRGDRIARVARNKRIVFTLIRSGEGSHTVERTVSGETIPASSKNLMSVCLMAYVPHQIVGGGIHHVMQRNRELNGAE